MNVRRSWSCTSFTVLALAVLLLLMVGDASKACAPVWSPGTLIYAPPSIGSPIDGEWYSQDELVTCSICVGLDPDIRYDPNTGQTTYPEDTLIYTWSATAGTFPGGNVGKEVSWDPPDDPGATVTVTVVISDQATIPSGETGTRDDTEHPSRSSTIHVGGVFISDLDGANKAGSNISGTDCWVKMWMRAMKPSTDYDISMYLNNQGLASGVDYVKVDPASPAGQTKARTDANGNYPDASVKGNVYFPSTNLADGTTGPLKAKASASGRSHDSNEIAGVSLYNKAYVVGNGTSTTYGDTTADNTNGSYAGMNHTATPATGSNSAVHKPTIRDNIAPNTAFYTYTHAGWDIAPYGDQTEFRDCDSSPGDDVAAHCLPSSQVSSDVGAKSGSQPGYNFVFIDACETSDHDDMAKAFGTINADGTTKTDRAYLGWNGETDDDLQASQWTGRLFSTLSSGNTLNQAIAAADNFVNPPGTHNPYGDLGMKLQKVY